MLAMANDFESLKQTADDREAESRLVPDTVLGESPYAKVVAALDPDKRVPARRGEVRAYFCCTKHCGIEIGSPLLGSPERLRTLSRSL